MESYAKRSTSTVTTQIPHFQIAQHLVEDIERSWFGCMEHELWKSCNVTLGQPQPEFADAMKAINERIVDLMIPFKQKNSWYIVILALKARRVLRVLPLLFRHFHTKSLIFRMAAVLRRFDAGCTRRHS